MIKSLKLENYDKWVEINKPKKFTLYDYIQGMRSNGVEVDFCIAIFKLAFPEFYQLDGMFFLREEFDQKKYDNLINQGYKNADIEYWMNLLNIDGIFETTSDEQNDFIVQCITLGWEKKLLQDFPSSSFEVKVLEDDGETYLSFYQSNLTR